MIYDQLNYADSVGKICLPYSARWPRRIAEFKMTDIYTHAMKAANEKAAETLETLLI